MFLMTFAWYGHLTQFPEPPLIVPRSLLLLISSGGIAIFSKHAGRAPTRIAGLSVLISAARLKPFR